MLVASDTSPISNLAIIGRLNLLQVQFREIWIPGAVQSELGQLSGVPLREIQQAVEVGWIKPRKLQDDKVARLLESTLDPGEAEAIALAIEISADLVLLDEKEGRAAAERAGLHVTGILGVLLRAKKAGEIAAVTPELESLRARARFFIAPELEQKILRSAGE
jgi:predicted nucleic acid-binding protein